MRQIILSFYSSEKIGWVSCSNQLFELFSLQVMGLGKGKGGLTKGNDRIIADPEEALQKAEHVIVVQV